jgi:hypothetical protein
MYLAHTYGRYPASANAVSKVLQYISDEVLPLAGKPLYDYLGLGDLPFQRFDFWSFQNSTRTFVTSCGSYPDNDLGEEEIVFRYLMMLAIGANEKT